MFAIVINPLVLMEKGLEEDAQAQFGLTGHHQKNIVMERMLRATTNQKILGMLIVVCGAISIMTSRISAEESQMT